MYYISFQIFTNSQFHILQQCPLLCPSVPGQPSKFQVGAVSDTSIELTWEPAFEKEGIINYELRYSEGSFGTQVRVFIQFEFQHLLHRAVSIILFNDPTLHLCALLV